MTHKDKNYIEPINWNRIPDHVDKDVWDKLTANFWLPEKVPMGNDIPSWNTLTDDEKDAVNKVFGGLTALDTVQGSVGAVSLMEDAVTPHEESVLANINFMEAFTEDTELLTQNGWISIRDIQDHHDVVQFDLKTRKLSVASSDDVKIIESHVSDKTYTIKVNKDIIIEQTVSPNHEVYLEFRRPDSNRIHQKKVKARELQNELNRFSEKNYTIRLKTVSVQTELDELSESTIKFLDDIRESLEIEETVKEIYNNVTQNKSLRVQNDQKQYENNIQTFKQIVGAFVGIRGRLYYDYSFDERLTFGMPGLELDEPYCFEKVEDYGLEVIENTDPRPVYCVQVPTQTLLTRVGGRGHTLISSNCVHAKSYSTIFSTLCSTREIDDIFRWVNENQYIRDKERIVLEHYHGDDPLKKKIASVLLESFLFYSGFYLPLWWSSRGKLTNTADIIRLIIRDEAVHGYYIGYKFQKAFDKETPERQEELREFTYNLLLDLMENEEQYTEDIYDSVGLTEDVKKFLKYNANKALMNLGFDALYSREESDTSAAIMSALSGNANENHDFFSGSGSSYVMGVTESSEDDDWDF